MLDDIDTVAMMPRDVIPARNTRRGSYVRSNKNKIRSMVTGRYYKSKKSVLNADRAIVKYYQNLEENREHLTTIGRSSGGPGSRARGKVLLKAYDLRNNPLRVLHQREIMAKVWENENQTQISVNYLNSPDYRKRVPRVPTKNGVQIVQKVEMPRVAPGEEHLLEKAPVTGVQHVPVTSRRIIF